MQENIPKRALGYAIILPAFILLGLFRLYPILRNFILSFTSWDMVTADPRFIGIANYLELFSDEDFFSSIVVTLEYAVSFIVLSLVVGLALSLCMTAKNKMNIFYRTVFFSPTVTSMVAMSAVWLFIYHPQYGSLNSILGMLGIQPVRWLNTMDTALPSLVMMNVWKRMGFCTVVYLGALLGISSETVEAARIDGANEWQLLWHIKLPLISPTTFMLVILMTIESFQVFTQINVMTQGGPNGSTTNLVTYMYMQAFDQFRVGYGSAIAVVLLAIVLLIYLIQMYFERFVNYD